MAMQIIKSIYRLLILLSLALLGFSCEVPNWDYDPYSENFGPSYSGLGFFVNGNKYTNRLYHYSYLFSRNYEIRLNWNTCSNDGESGIFIKTEVKCPESENGKVSVWEYNSLNRVFIDQYLWVYFPMEKIRIGEEILVDNPNSVINLTFRQDEFDYSDYTFHTSNRITTHPFKHIWVTFTEISKNNIEGSFSAEVEFENMGETITLKLESGVFALREEQKIGSYESWLNDYNRRTEW